MRWMNRNLFDSVQGALGRAPTARAVSANHRMENIRQVMLDCLGETGRRAFPSIERRVKFATDVQGLWYLRGDMMEALSTLMGESLARARLEEVSTLFRGLVPSGMCPRQSRLGP